jgi:hypothetical protein
MNQPVQMALSAKDEQARYHQVLRRLKETPHVSSQEIDIVNQHITMLGFQITIDKALPVSQAKVDAIMLEYCQDMMTKQQMDEYARNQKPVVCTPEQEEEFIKKIGDLIIVDENGQKTPLSQF